MSKTLWAVIGLVVLNFTAPQVAVQLASWGINPMALIAMSSLSLFCSLTLAALDPKGIIRREIDAPDMPPDLAPDPPAPPAEPAPAVAAPAGEQPHG